MQLETRLASCYCYEDWPAGPARLYYTLVSSAVQFLAPCSTVILSYTRIALALRPPPSLAKSNLAKRKMARWHPLTPMVGKLH